MKTFSTSQCSCGLLYLLRLKWTFLKTKHFSFCPLLCKIWCLQEIRLLSSSYRSWLRVFAVQGFFSTFFSTICDFSKKGRMEGRINSRNTTAKYDVVCGKQKQGAKSRRSMRTMTPNCFINFY